MQDSCDSSHVLQWKNTFYRNRVLELLKTVHHLVEKPCILNKRASSLGNRIQSSISFIINALIEREQAQIFIESYLVKDQGVSHRCRDSHTLGYVGLESDRVPMPTTGQCHMRPFRPCAHADPLGHFLPASRGWHGPGPMPPHCHEAHIPWC